MNRTQIPKGLLIGLAGIAAASVIGVAFLLGREAGRRTPAEFRHGSNGAEVSAASANTPSKPGEATAPVLQLAPTGTSATSAGGLPGSVVSPVDSTSASVAAYFQAAENSQPSSNGDPESIARQVLAGLSKGDMSGFDGMIQQTHESRSRLSMLVPPQPCAAYHRESLASLDAGLDMMRAMKKALSSPGQDAQLMDLAGQANALKARADALQLQEKALKQRYGLMK